jgi:hypothetical protein
MAHSEALLDGGRLRKVLIVVLDHIAAALAPVDYRLVGTGAALLHGVELPAADIDLLVKERADVDAIGAALSPYRCLTVPAWLPCTRQYYANYEVRGVEVGISTVEIESDSDTIETFGRGPWERYVQLPCGSHTVPTVALELRLITELFRSRPDRYQPIIRYLQEAGCDSALIARGMAAAGLPEDLQERVLEQLGVPPTSGASTG